MPIIDERLHLSSSLSHFFLLLRVSLFTSSDRSKGLQSGNTFINSNHQMQLPQTARWALGLAAALQGGGRGRGHPFN